MMDAAFAQTVLEHSPDALLLLAPDGSITFLNSAAEQLFGYSRTQLLGADYSLLLAEASRGDFHAFLAGLSTNSSEATAGTRMPFAGAGRRGDASVFPLEITCAALPPSAGTAGDGGAVALSVRPAASSPLAGAAGGAFPGREHDGGTSAGGTSAGGGSANGGPANGGPAGSSTGGAGDLAVNPSAGGGLAGGAPAGAVWAAASRAASAAAAARRRTFGPLESLLIPSTTGLLPRLTPVEQDDQLKAAVLRDTLTGLPNGTLFNERLAAALRRPDPLDVLLLNVDDFKSYNDMLGRSAADELLVEVASRLRNCVRPHDTVARLGGDEFAILLTECLNVGAVAKRISESLYTPARVGGSVVRPAVSMGLASRTAQMHDGAELLRQADSALAAAKAAGKNTWLQFRPEMLATAAQKEQGETGLRQAVELGQISVHYQPVVSPGLGAVVQFEAFARWERHGRLVPPNQFLPVAEQSGLIREIGDEVLRRACAEIRPWLAGDAAYSVAVNVSGLQFQHREFATDVLDILVSTGVHPRQLMLELTESVFFDAGSDVLRQLRQLRQAGVRIAMDDFGTGYSTLGRLKELPLDKVKIDRSFVAMIKTGKEHLPFFRTMINTAQELGLKVTAEGIETPVQAKYLMDLGCDSLQGYLFAKPAPASDLAGTMESALTAIDKVEAPG
ncbi:sensor domain-containing phosphodiesterase [Arthrobacter sp. B3I4]|uniref:sensor domain-containing protein n=1 Tax=Arthrobacter sp. B3I4 TaxID=3042267 RepID=UPI00277D2AE2|nr:sensor domain-containing phosphodiesterase [Arthrobacter sp. B3I4]MDQ0757268.1 diguanylate cyclase (GGDEF)-like protein/PAS domain S-box-containing protein [Arthrobacter sp. B3I4]